ncbi:uncharacterized protein LOC113306072 [Papaver somniferum]|uniref:uncharacterized protein LOC113306072 n=1 Tax=Papaver somniferum TaxID=3469 RepID=UPI000E70473F|nr:uncharacterized protein LOC113306072 [Papaver somniferum]
MLIFSWNCRGLSNISTVRNLKAFLRSCNPQLAFLTETLIGELNSHNFYNSFGFDNFKCIPAIGRSGGSVILWNNDISLEVISADKNVIHCRIRQTLGQNWNLLCVYGPSEHYLRNNFWKHGGSQKLNTANKEFKNFISDRRLIDLGFVGATFTWSNGVVVDNPIFERLDMALCTTEWLLMFPYNGVLHLPRVSSDHAPIIINIHRTNKRKRKFSYKFEYYWVDNPEFNDVVHRAWTSRNGNTLIKINEVGMELSKWSIKSLAIYSELQKMQRMSCCKFNVKPISGTP